MASEDATFGGSTNHAAGSGVRAQEARRKWQRRLGLRYRTGGPGSRRLQRGGFTSERDAAEALKRALERLRRQNGVGSQVTLAELINEYLAQHDAEPETIAKLRWLLGKALGPFGKRRLSELRSQEIAAWRMTIPPGHRFEATQALARGVVWGMIDVNPAKRGGRESPAAADRETTVRIVDTARAARRSHRPALRADGDVRGRDRLAPWRVDGA